MTSGAMLPNRLEDFDAAWLDDAIGGVRAARVIKIIHGTATKICMEVDRTPQHAPATHRVWIKTGMEPHSAADRRLDNVYAGETLFYRIIAGRFETRTPHCYFADTDSAGHSVIVLDDLESKGATFVDPTRPASIGFVSRALTSIARFHAASWMSPELEANEWLRMGGSHRAYDFLTWLYDPTHWAEYAPRPRFQMLDPTLRERTVLERAHRRLQDEFWPAAPRALAHGDCHYGQAYELPDGEVRLLDWQGSQMAHWAHDVAYFMTGALSVADRRSAERDLLGHYLDALVEFGVARPDWNAAWRSYAANALHGVGWVMCPVEMQPEENCAAFVERFSTAVTDLGSLGIIAKGPQ